MNYKKIRKSPVFQRKLTLEFPGQCAGTPPSPPHPWLPGLFWNKITMSKDPTCPKEVTDAKKDKTTKRSPEKAERRSNASENDPDEEQVPPQILHVRQQLAKYNQ